MGNNLGGFSSQASDAFSQIFRTLKVVKQTVHDSSGTKYKSEEFQLKDGAIPETPVSMWPPTAVTNSKKSGTLLASDSQRLS